MEDSAKSIHSALVNHGADPEVRRLLLLDRRIVEIASWLTPSRLLNPTLLSRRRALDQFRETMRGGAAVDPYLEYLPLPREEMARTAQALDALTFGDTPVDVLLREQVDQLYLQLALLRARGTRSFGALSVRIYGLPDTALLQVARRILQGEYALERFPAGGATYGQERIDEHSMAASMCAELSAMGITGWKVSILDEMSARMSVSARHREVRIKSDSLFTKEDERRLIVHELRTHVVRACNGFATGLHNLGLGLRDYMATEEGLASVMEEEHGLLQREQVQTYAYRALGAWLAHDRGFVDTFRALLELGASPGLAWDVSMRVKRGLTDTSLPGAFTKDYVYLHGRELVIDYLDGGGVKEDLFLGKIAIQHIPMVKEILSKWNFAQGEEPG